MKKAKMGFQLNLQRFNASLSLILKNLKMDLKVAVSAKKRKCKMKRRKKNKNIIKLLGKQTLKEATMRRKNRKTR